MNFLSRKLPVTFYLFTMKDKVSAGKINSTRVSHLLRLLRHCQISEDGKTGQNHKT